MKKDTKNMKDKPYYLSHLNYPTCWANALSLTYYHPK